MFDPFQYTMQNPYGATAGEGTDDPAVGDRWNWTMGLQQHQWLHSVLSTSTAKYKFLLAHHMLGGTQNYVRGGAEPAHQFEFEIPALSKEDEQLQRMVAHLAEENPSSIAEIIQLWLNEDEK